MRAIAALWAWVGCTYGAAAPLVSAPGDRAVVPGWRIASTADDARDLAVLSQPGVDVSTWHAIPRRGTIMGGLLDGEVYKDSELFFSNNLATVAAAFGVPWLYRQEFALQVETGQHYFVQTHGITSRADILVNGRKLISKDEHVGAYAGRTLDITPHARNGTNALLIRAWPTDYSRDFAVGFEDWNPYPPDNGTGVWRDVHVLQTGSVALSPPRITTDFDGSARAVTATITVDLRNHLNRTLDASVTGDIAAKNGPFRATTSKRVTLQPHEQRTVALAVTIRDAQVWWPAGWGRQPLYEAQARVTVSGEVSDISEKRAFGIRHVTSHVNRHNDTAFTVNGAPFLVMGAGYTPDLFLRFDVERVRRQLQAVLDLGLNTIRLEGKQEQPALYDLADELGVMVLPGWECCDKWEGWSYNDEGNGVTWTDADYATAAAQMQHEAALMQSHPSILGFLVGSDYWPDDRATDLYIDTLQQMDWPNPIVASAAKRGYPARLGPSGMKMDGPYDWVPPQYWYGDQLGAALGFGSELGAGVGTPELTTLKQFLSDADLEDLWTQPDKSLYHMSRNPGKFANRQIYNAALYARYGPPTSLDDYLLKAQLMDYEATRAQYEAYAARKSAARPATGLIYWMLNGAWPSLHWQLFDYSGRGAGSYYGTKMGTRQEHVVYDYDRSVYLVSHARTTRGRRRIEADLIDLSGKSISRTNVTVPSAPNAARAVMTIPGIDKLQGTGLLKLTLHDASGATLSRNTYWVPRRADVLDWTNSTWWYTPVSTYANMTDLFRMKPATVHTTASRRTNGVTVTLDNHSDVPAFFLRLELPGSPAAWSDNYFTLWPRESVTVTAAVDGDPRSVTVRGGNVPVRTITVGGY